MNRPLPALSVVLCALAACSADTSADEPSATSRSGGGRSDRDRESEEGGSSSAVTVRVDTGLARDTALSELDEAQSREACDAVAETATTVLSDAETALLSCTLAALVELAFTSDSGGAVDSAECQQLTEACVGEGGEPDSLYSCDPELLDLESCDAVIADFETCFGDTLAAIEEVSQELSCESAAEGLDPVLLETALQAPPSCVAIQAQCPGFDISDSGGADEPLSGPTPDDGCDDSCRYSGDGVCDDGGPDAELPICNLGTDCEDCGPR